MQDSKQKIAAKAFAEKWKDRGYEKGESQTFWLELLHNVLGVDNPYDIITFENQVQLSHTSFIDAYIIPTKVLIEQKSIDKDLRKPVPQSDGTALTPFQQAKRYAAEMPYSKRPRWVVTCNFKSFLIYDMEQPNGEPEELLLENLEREAYRLQFLVDERSEHLRREMQVSMQAGEIVGRIYEALLKQYDDASPEALRWLNILCVRIVFCLYAEDAGIFARDQFHNYLAKFDAESMRMALFQLFDTLNKPIDRRSKFLRDDLKAFPYTNGGLFTEEIEIPQFTDELRETLLQNAALDFDWSEISPTIFGAVFESTLNPETRRSGGMHYTSIENIHKVIDPLFLNDLRHEYEAALEEKIERQRARRLDALQDKLASLTFFDPACGSGNFLTETYLSLRRLENDIIRERHHGQMMLGEFSNPIKVSINQFYGIEINDFAVTVATTALWISEAQMLSMTERIIHQDIDFLPLKTYSNIVEGNALRIDWESVVPKEKLDYIIGNPPFVGYSLQSKEQKEDILSVFVDEKGKPFKTAGKIDYVAGWYYKAAAMMSKNPSARAALVSTNSITQGDQVSAIWRPLMTQFNLHIDFAWRTFIWDSEASLKAHVHCVIIGFSIGSSNAPKKIYDNAKEIIAHNINGYLIDAENVFIDSINTPLCSVPSMIVGNRPADGGNLIIEDEDYDAFIQAEPTAKKYIKRLMGSVEFINNKKRWCLWLVGISPSELKSMPKVLERVKACREDRLAAPDIGRRKLADKPTQFRETNNPDHAIVIPEVSSARRRYIPISFIGNDIICTNKLQLIPDATLYHFGILESNVHMAWMRAVCGRLKSDYDYSKKVVYNNFPWPNPTPEQKARIEQTAQAILDARALYPDSSLADLYDEVTMPPELRRAHQDNDRAVMAAYGFPVKGFTESDCVARLFEMYQGLTK